MATFMNKHDYNNFDLIRLLAALEVAVGHTFTWLKVPLPQMVHEFFLCFPGVAIFFVVSGFLITRSYVEGGRGLPQFLAHRALRIYPALWLQYLFVFVLLACTGGFALHTLADPMFYSWIGVAMFLGSNFVASVVMASTPFTLNGLYKGYPADVLWTIPVELAFYLLVPVVFAKGVARRGYTGTLIFFLFVASVGMAYIAGPLLRDHSNLNSVGILHTSPVPYFWLFLTGGTIAFYWKKLAYWFEGQAHWWLLLVGAGSAINWTITGSIALPYRIPDELAVPRALILAGAVISFAYSWTWLSQWMRGVDLSYGLYLFHFPLPYGLHFAGIGGSLWLAAVSIVAAFILAAASWFFVESRALKMKPVADKLLQSFVRQGKPLSNISVIGLLTIVFVATLSAVNATVQLSKSTENNSVAVLERGKSSDVRLSGDNIIAYPGNLVVSNNQIDELLSRTNLVAENMSVIDKKVVIIDGRLSFKDDAPASYSYVLQLPSNSSKGNDYLVAEGELFEGGLTLGLLKNNQWAGQSNITTPGKFKIVMKPEAGDYMATLAHNLPNQKSNHFALTKLGWVILEGH